MRLLLVQGNNDMLLCFVGGSAIAMAHADARLVCLRTKRKLCRCLCRWFQPFLGFVMANLAQEAVEGMQKKLQGMAEKGQLKPERATAAA